MCLSKSESIEKAQYFEGYSSQIHQEFCVVHCVSQYTLAKSYYNVSRSLLSSRQYKEANQKLNLAVARFQKYKFYKEKLPENKMPIDLAQIYQDHEEIENGLKQLDFHIQALNFLQ